MISPRICAVVVTCNRWACLQQCLTGIRQQTFPLAGVLVVDNASSDGTSERLASEFPWAQHIRLPENVGSSGGFFEGMKRAYEEGFDWLWIMDDDAVPESATLQTMVESEQFESSDTGALAPHVLGTDGRTDLRSRPGRFDFRRFRSMGVLDGAGVEKEIMTVNYATFVGLLVHRRAIAKVGLPRREFFIAWDDVDFVSRLCAAGFVAYLIPKATILHLNAGANDQIKLAFLPSYTRLPITALWKCYYTWRNRIYLAHQYSPRHVLFRESCKLAAGILMFDDYKFRRLKVLLRAVRDGATGRLGPSFDIGSAVPAGQQRNRK